MFNSVSRRFAVLFEKGIHQWILQLFLFFFYMIIMRNREALKIKIKVLIQIFETECETGCFRIERLKHVTYAKTVVLNVEPFYFHVIQVSPFLDLF